MTAANHKRLAICTLVLLPLVWLWPCVFGGKTLVPFDPAQFPPAAMTLSPDELAETKAGSNFDVTEVWPWLLPEMELAQREIAAGHLPVWDPNARTGAPLHEVGVLGVFYPPHWLWMFGGDPKSWLVWLTWISLALAGFCTFGLLSQVGLSPLAAWFGAATFELSGPMAANGFFFTRLPGLAWLPAMLWALMRLAEGDRMRPGPLAAVAITVAMPWLPGFPPYASAGLLIAGLLAVRLVLERTGREGQLAGKRLIVRLGFGVLLGALLTMPQVLPSLWFYSNDAARSADTTFEVLRSTRFDPYGLLGYLMPDAYGHPVTGHDLPYGNSPLPYLWCDRYDDAGKAITPNYNYTEYSVFAGTLGLLMAGFGLLRGRDHMRGFTVVTLILLLGLALYLPVVRWLYYLPVVKNVFAMRWLAPGTLLVCWLAAIGFDRLRHVERAVVGRLAAATLVLAGAVFYLTPIPAEWHAADPEWPASSIAERFQVPHQVAVEAIQGPQTAIDRFAIATERFADAGTEAVLWLLLCFGALLAYTVVRAARPRQLIFAALPLITIVQLGLHGAGLLPGQRLANGTDTAVHTFLREQAQAARDVGGFTIARAGDAGIPAQLPPGQLMVPGIRDLHFYSHGDKRTIEPLRALLGTDWSPQGASHLKRVLPDAGLEHPLLDLLGVRYVLATQPLQHAGARVGPQLRGSGREFFVYERPNALPRAFTVPALRALPGDVAVVAALADTSLQPDREALVVGSAAAPTSASGDARKVNFVRDDPGVVELDIAAGDHDYLVFTDTWLPGWSATIDGEATAIDRCNHSQRLVRLPGRACRVRFEFSPPMLPYGIALWLLAIAGLSMPFIPRRGSSGVSPGDEKAE